jgi:hypothetical protein
MVSFFRSSLLFVIVSLVLSGGILAWRANNEISRVDQLTAQGSPEPTRDESTATGYAQGQRWLIAPDQHKEAYALIAETQQMVATGEWRLREVAYDNSPAGRAVDRASPYRWTLAAVARTARVFSGDSPGLSIERTARWIEPALQGIFLIFLTLLTWRRFGAVSAGVIALGWSNLYPMAGNFVAGAPNDYGLTLGVVTTALFYFAGGMMRRPSDGPKTQQRGFQFSGFLGGLAVWITPGIALTLATALALGGIVLMWLDRTRFANNKTTATPQLPWRAWATTAAITILIGFLLEYAPAHLSEGLKRFDLIHPVHAIYWWGLGELLVGIYKWRTTSLPFRARLKQPVPLAGMLLALIALAGSILGLVMAHQFGRLWFDAALSKLAAHAGSVEAQNFGSWFSRHLSGPTLFVTLLPLMILGPALYLLLRNGPRDARRQAIVVLLGPVTISLGLGFAHLQWWNLVGATLLVLLALLLKTESKPNATSLMTVRLGFAAATLAILPGAISLARISAAPPHSAVAAAEASSLLERDIAYWLANRAGPGGATVLAPPNLTTSIFFHGGLRGIASPYPGNSAGFGAAVRIAGATSPDEALALVNQRKLTHIIMPSWDGFMDEYARLGATQVEHTLTTMLHQWLPPRWLKPVPFTLPVAAGLEEQFVVVYEVVDVQDNATALGRLGEYFIAMQQSGLARSVATTLEASFANDLGALVARANIAAYQKDLEKFIPLIEQITRQVADLEYVDLPWDRRVSLAVVLAQGKQIEAARLEAESCADEADEALLRSLSTDALYRWEILRDNLQLTYLEPELETLARNLLPPHLQQTL